MKVYHRFAYSAPLVKGEETRPFKTRDGAAFNELTADFSASGYRYGSLIYNYPFSPHFAADHIKDLAGFAARVIKPSEKDEVSKFLAKKFSEGTRKMLSSVSSSSAATDPQKQALVENAQKQVLAKELNDLVDGKSLYGEPYQEPRFKGLRLSPRTEALGRKGHIGSKEVARLNRYLLEDAYLCELARIHDILRLDPQNFSFLRADRDILVLTTRPPLDDERHDDRRCVARSHTGLENAVFAGIRDCIQECARKKVRIAPEMAQHLKGESIQKAETRYHLHKDGRMVEFLALDQPKPSTVSHDEYLTTGFFIHLTKIEDFGCEIIASFGMGGIETLIWNRIIRNHPQYRSWITKPYFVFAELDLKNMPFHPITLHFVDQIGVKILLEKPL